MAEEYRFKSYERLLEEALNDESSAGEMYRYMANVSPDASAARRLREIANDEDHHHLMVTHLLAELMGTGETEKQYVERMETALGHRSPGQREGNGGTHGQMMREHTMMNGGMGMHQHRPMPQTYTDWSALGQDVKDKDSSSETAFKVNDILTAILNNEPGADEGKRWLMMKARQLGIG